MWLNLQVGKQLNKKKILRHNIQEKKQLNKKKYPSPILPNTQYQDQGLANLLIHFC